MKQQKSVQKGHNLMLMCSRSSANLTHASTGYRMQDNPLKESMTAPQVCLSNLHSDLKQGHSQLGSSNSIYFRLWTATQPYQGKKHIDAFRMTGTFQQAHQGKKLKAEMGPNMDHVASLHAYAAQTILARTAHYTRHLMPSTEVLGQ